MSRDARLQILLAPIEWPMERMREELGVLLRAETPSVSDMVDHLGRFRGKQLRAALVLLAGEATGNVTDEHPTVAAIVELIHLATLVHDDVLDGAETRRRVASVNQRWDNQVAVLLGDFLYARAFQRSTQLSSRLCSSSLSETTQVICAGEIDQAAGRWDFEMSQERYESIAGAKTAALYRAACELGARYPGGREELGHELGRFGWEIGLAFQIIDDLLDVVGDEAVVGKTVGNDVADGKVTLPVLHTYARADEPVRARIRDVYTLPDLDDRATRLREVCDLNPGVDYARARADELTQSALGRLALLPESSARSALESVGNFVLQRRW
ncbi:MAG: polyprenyl synthetase family protein [bacterium]|nr:polyprenyl synthetase family protein [bacterium]